MEKERKAVSRRIVFSRRRQNETAGKAVFFCTFCLSGRKNTEMAEAFINAAAPEFDAGLLRRPDGEKILLRSIFQPGRFCGMKKAAGDAGTVRPQSLDIQAHRRLAEGAGPIAAGMADRKIQLRRPGKIRLFPLGTYQLRQIRGRRKKPAKAADQRITGRSPVFGAKKHGNSFCCLSTCIHGAYYIE